MALKVEPVKQNQDDLNRRIVEPQINKPQTADVSCLPDADKNLFLRQNRLGAETFKLSLLARFDEGGGARGVPAADPKKVEDAVNSIKQSLSEGFLDWDVTHGDLNNIRDTFKNLNAEEANQVFQRLSDDDLQKWVDELNGLNGSFSREEKQQLFGELAGKLNGANLARLARVLGSDGFDAGDLGRAIGQHSSAQTKVDFVHEMAGSLEANRGASEAVAEVIGGLQNDPAALERAIGSLSDTQLQKL